MIRLLLCCVLVILGSNVVFSRSTIREFPEGFIFGASTSAYQIEGGWDEDGKGTSIWDVYSQMKPSPVADGSNAKVAADSYHLYRRDVEMMTELGLNFYRFSISWPRILPNGFANDINQVGLNYYNNLINDLIKNNISPFLTLYYWDLPHELQKLGGWVNPLIADWFSDYARIVFEHFGDRVKFWITVNEPRQICHEGYGGSSYAPGVNMSGIAEYICAKNLLIAHARVYRIYDEEFRKRQGGKVGISISGIWYEPASDSMVDYQASVDAMRFYLGHYAHPIFYRLGDYPIEVKNRIVSKSAEQGFPRSRLPELSASEVVLIKGTADFFGLNAYSTKMAYRDASLVGMYPVPSNNDDLEVMLVKDDSWPNSASLWLQEVPWGFYKLLMEIKTTYDNPPIYITENGWSTAGGLVDEDRIRYLRNYLNALLDAIYEGCNVKGYSVWSLMDNFEWTSGYRVKFGLYEVDFSSEKKTRTPRKSAFVYKEIIRTHALDFDYEPEQYLEEVRESKEGEKGDVNDTK